MAFDPSVPAINADLDADPIRDNFNALKGLIDAIPTSGQTPGGSAGGDLSGTYPNPMVIGIANAIAASGGYPPGDASNLTHLNAANLTGALPAIDASALLNIPLPPTLKSGVGNLDGSGQLDISGATTGAFAVGSWYNTAGTGKLLTMAAPLRIVSDAGMADSGMTVCWVAF